jgi:uncharacterized protein YecT (DUF1311 family)
MKTLLHFSAVLTLASTLWFIAPAHGSAEGEELRAADAELNAGYQKALAAMPSASTKAKLKEAQRAWIAFRDAQIALNGELPGATGNQLKMLQTELTQERTKQLKELVEAAK